MHCQHKEKSQTLKQKQKAAEMKSKQSKKPCTGSEYKAEESRMPINPQINCDSANKKADICKCKAIQPSNNSVSHPAILQVSYTHNHPLESAHVLAFRPIAKKTSLRCSGKATLQPLIFTGMKQSCTWMEGEDQISLRASS